MMRNIVGIYYTITLSIGSSIVCSTCNAFVTPSSFAGSFSISNNNNVDSIASAGVDDLRDFNNVLLRSRLNDKKRVCSNRTFRTFRLYSSTRDFYKILGVPRNADMKAIKSGYRKKAKEYHPGKLEFLCIILGYFYRFI